MFEIEHSLDASFYKIFQSKRYCFLECPLYCLCVEFNLFFSKMDLIEHYHWHVCFLKETGPLKDEHNNKNWATLISS